MGKTYGETLDWKDVDEQEVVLENNGTFCSKSCCNFILDMERRTNLMMLDDPKILSNAPVV